MRPANSNDKGALHDVARKSIDGGDVFLWRIVRLTSTSPRKAPAWSRSSKVACSSPDVNVAHGIRDCCGRCRLSVMASSTLRRSK